MRFLQNIKTSPNLIKTPLAIQAKGAIYINPA